jgi:hypothetical protein
MGLVVSEQFGISHKQFIERFMRVPNKAGELVDFTLSRIQDLELSESSDIQRDQYVKPAQVGSTTLWMAVGMSEVLTNIGRTAAIVSYDDEHAGRLLLKGSQLYSALKTEEVEENGHINKFVWPTLDRENKKELFFKDFASTIFTGSARSYNFGRGEPIHLVVLSECAFYPDVTSVVDPLLKRCPDFGRFVIESTPNGQSGDGEWFYETYQAGMRGESIWKPHFYPWWFHEEYYYEYGSRFALPADKFELEALTDDELQLMELHDLDEGHIRWRRRKKLESKQAFERGDSSLLFDQEYPENDTTCFLTTGDAYLDSFVIERLLKQCYIPKESFHNAAVWYPPEEGHDYSITIDPGMGKTSNTVLNVWEVLVEEVKVKVNDIEETHYVEYPRHCLTASGKFLESQTVDLAETFQEYYNGALIVPESNIPAVAALLVERRNKRIYMQEDIISGVKTQRPGWRTTPMTIQFMFSELSRILPNIITHDANLVRELPNLKNIDGRLQTSKNSDYLMACAIFAATRRSSRPAPKPTVQYRPSWPDKR